MLKNIKRLQLKDYLEEELKEMMFFPYGFNQYSKQKSIFLEKIKNIKELIKKTEEMTNEELDCFVYTKNREDWRKILEKRNSYLLEQEHLKNLLEEAKNWIPPVNKTKYIKLKNQIICNIERDLNICNKNLKKDFMSSLYQPVTSKQCKEEILNKYYEELEYYQNEYDSIVKTNASDEIFYNTVEKSFINEISEISKENSDWKPFNEDKSLTLEVEFKGEKLTCEVFEESSSEDSKIENNFNLIAIEFQKDLPFYPKIRSRLFDGQKHYGYIVEVSDNQIQDIYLLITGFGWGETDTLIKDCDLEEYEFVVDIINKAKMKELANQISKKLGYKIEDCRGNEVGFWIPWHDTGAWGNLEQAKQDCIAMNEKDEVLWYWDSKDMKEILDNCI